jgi:hypothetical protein
MVLQLFLSEEEIVSIMVVSYYYLQIPKELGRLL